MGFITALVAACNGLTGFFYEIYQDVFYWPWPFSTSAW